MQQGHIKDKQHQSDVYSQLQSLFFQKLPLELRQAIYAEVLTSRTMHLWVVNARIELTYVECKKDVEDFQHSECWSAMGPRQQTNESSSNVKKHIMPLLLSCQRISNEAVVILYSGASFSIAYFSVDHFFDKLPVHHLARLSTLSLYWAFLVPPYAYANNRTDWMVDADASTRWEEACERAAALPKLKKLCLYIVMLLDDQEGEEWDAEEERKMLEPVARIAERGVAVTIIAQWREPEASVLPQSPYRVVRTKFENFAEQNV